MDIVHCTLHSEVTLYGQCPSDTNVTSCELLPISTASYITYVSRNKFLFQEYMDSNTNVVL